jgi:hypothetical protein
MKENFVKNYDKILEFVESKKDCNEIQTVGIFSMATKINYIQLKEKLLHTKNIIIDLDNVNN